MCWCQTTPLQDVNWEFVFMQTLRWIHVFAGIIWIGLLYFFNFVNVPFAKTLDAESKKKVVPELMPRALWWFRYMAMVTVVIGLLYLVLWYFVLTGSERRGFTAGPEGLLKSDKGMWITFGIGLGLVMFFNVWAIIWPSQKKIISWVKQGQAPPEMGGLAKKALMASRINTFLSFPMLFGMVGGGHGVPFNWVLVVGVTGVGFLVAWMLISASQKVSSAV